MPFDRPRREIVAITGGRLRFPTLAELAELELLLADWGTLEVRHGACPPRKNKQGELVGSTDTYVAAWLKARTQLRVEPYPADWKRHGLAAGPIRNREMLAGVRPGHLLREHQAHALVAFAGGTGTLDCQTAAAKLGIHVHPIAPVDEPRIWNSHHGKPPGPALYCGRPSPVGNPDKVPPKLTAEQRAAFAVQALADYKRWLWRRINKSSRLYDPAVVEYILRLTAQHFAVCGCAPADCHVEIVIAAWRWLMGIAERVPRVGLAHG